MAEVSFRSLPICIRYGDNLVTRHKGRHALWLFSDTKSISISNLVGCAYIWSMNLQRRERGCLRKQMDWKNVTSSLWISGFSAVKWESCTKWSLKSLPAPKCPHFTYHQSNWIIGLWKFRSFPEASEKYLKKNWFLPLCLEGTEICFPSSLIVGFPCGSAGKQSACNAGDLGSIPELGRSPEGGKDYPLQYSGLENSMDSIVHGFTKSRAWLSDLHFH